MESGCAKYSQSIAGVVGKKWHKGRELRKYDPLSGAEYTEIIEDTLSQETGYLHFVRLERIGEIICCTFEIGKEDYYYPDSGY